MSGWKGLFKVDPQWEYLDGWHCPECEKIYLKKENLISHYWHKHTEDGQQRGRQHCLDMSTKGLESVRRTQITCPNCGISLACYQEKPHQAICSQITPEMIKQCEQLYVSGHEFLDIQKQLRFTFSKSSFDRYVYSRFDPVKKAEAREKRKKQRISKTVRALYNSGFLCRVPIVCSSDDPRIFRTKWEREVAEILTSFAVTYQYEAISIPYTKQKSGENTVYIPDFYLPDFNLILEIKGDQQGQRRKTLDTAKAAIDNGYKFKLILNKMVSEEHILRVLRGYGYQG